MEQQITLFMSQMKFLNELNSASFSAPDVCVPHGNGLSSIQYCIELNINEDLYFYYFNFLKRLDCHYFQIISILLVANNLIESSVTTLHYKTVNHNPFTLTF